jgi:hypothetical protein
MMSYHSHQNIGLAVTGGTMRVAVLAHTLYYAQTMHHPLKKILKMQRH